MWLQLIEGSNAVNLINGCVRDLVFGWFISGDRKVMVNFRSHFTSKKEFVNRHHLWAALASYLLASTLLTWPLIFRLNSILFGDYGDTRGVVWSIWAKSNGLLDGPVNKLIAAPFGVPSESGFSQPVSDWTQLLLARFLNEIAAYNLYVYLSFPLAAFGTYFFLNRILDNKSAAFTGGLMFGFCPAVVMQAVGGHSTFAFNVFVPLFLLSLFYNRDKRTHHSAFLVALTFSLVTLNSLYFGYFATYIVVLFTVFDLFSSKKHTKGVIGRNYLSAATIALLLIVPFQYKAIYEQLTISTDTLVKMGRIRDLNQLTVYSSRLIEYLRPSINHPIWGKYIEDSARESLHGSNLFEQTLYLGIMPVCVFLLGILLICRKKLDVALRTYFLLFGVAALVMYCMSLPPMVSIGSIKLPSLSRFVYTVTPMFRVYSRFGILVCFFLACALSVVLASLFQSLKRWKYHALLAFLLPLLVFEYWSTPTSFSKSIDKPPAVYQWLAKVPDDFIIAEYPMMPADEASFYSYVFWQRIHKKRLVNGAVLNNTEAWAFHEKVRDLSNPETPQLLRAAGVKYVLVHSEYYETGPIPMALKRYYPEEISAMTYNNGVVPSLPSSLTLVESFGEDRVYSINP